jgi:hypothetical protein
MMAENSTRQDRDHPDRNIYNYAVTCRTGQRTLTEMEEEINGAVSDHVTQDRKKLY